MSTKLNDFTVFDLYDDWSYMTNTRSILVSKCAVPTINC